MCALVKKTIFFPTQHPRLYIEIASSFITHESLEVDGGVDGDVLLGDGGEQVAAAAEPTHARVAQRKLAKSLDVVDEQVHQPGRNTGWSIRLYTIFC